MCLKCLPKGLFVAKTRSFFSRGRKVQTTERFVADMERIGLVMQSAESGDGAEWTLHGKAKPAAGAGSVA